MRKGDFSLEILVDNEVLPEYEVSLSEKAKITRSREKKTITYIAAPYSSCHFCIRVGVHSTLGSMVYKGIHYVDGQNDDTYMELNPLNDDPYTYIYGFYNYDRTVFHKFKFDTNCWTENEIFVSNLPTRCMKSSKDSGVISVYVFTAERLHGKRMMSQIKNNQEMLPESLGSLDKIDPRDIIYLEKPQEEPMPNLRETSNKPIAELHIRYQTREWLRNEGFDLIESLDNSPINLNNISLFEDDESNNEIVISEQSEEITDGTDNDSKKGKKELKEFHTKTNEEEEYLPSSISDEEMENVHDSENDEEKEFESENFQDKVETESSNYGVIIRENLNKQLENKLINEEVVERRRIEVVITQSNIINHMGDVELTANERLNERIRDISINDKEENGTFINNKDEGGENSIVVNPNEFDSEFIDLTESPPKEIIEISDDNNDDEVILVETVRSLLPTTANKKKHRNKKIKYYSDSSIDWNNDDSSNYSDSSSEDEFISISKKRLRT